MTRPQLIAAIEAALADVGAEDITPEDVRTVLVALANSSYVPETDGEAVDGADGAPGADGSDGREIELQATGTHLQWRYVGEASWINLIALTAIKGDDGDAGAPGADGDDGREIELQNSGTHIQWRYVGDVSWTNLVALTALKGDQGDAGSNGTNGTDGDDGREIELQNSGTHIQWRYVGDVSWTNLVALTAIKGDQGDAGDDGADGNDGADGASAYAIAVANGFVGDVAAWLASLVGEDGDDGAPGADGSPDTAVQIRDKLATLTGEDRLDASAVKGVATALTAASQAEMEAGTETELRSMSPLRVKQAIDALGGGGVTPDALAEQLRQRPIYYNDFSRADQSVGDPWYPATIGTGGTVSSTTNKSDEHHHGVSRIGKGSNANSGGAVGFRFSGAPASNYQIIGGGEVFELIFQVGPNAAPRIWAGFHYANNITEPPYGIYIDIANDLTLSGKTAENSTRSTTGTTYALSAGVWYRMQIRVNDAGTQVDYYLYSAAGTELWHDSLSSTNFPTLRVNPFVNAHGTDTDTGDIAYLDWIAIWMTRSLTR